MFNPLRELLVTGTRTVPGFRLGPEIVIFPRKLIAALWALGDRLYWFTEDRDRCVIDLN